MYTRITYTSRLPFLLSIHAVYGFLRSPSILQYSYSDSHTYILTDSHTYIPLVHTDPHPHTYTNGRYTPTSTPDGLRYAYSILLLQHPLARSLGTVVASLVVSLFCYFSSIPARIHIDNDNDVDVRLTVIFGVESEDSV